MTQTAKLLKELNALRGRKYPEIGYSFYADVRGDGSNRKSVYTIVNENGGVTYSPLNGKTSRETCANIRRAIAG